MLDRSTSPMENEIDALKWMRKGTKNDTLLIPVSPYRTRCPICRHVISQSVLRQTLNLQLLMCTERRSNVACYCSESSQTTLRSLCNFMMQPWISFVLISSHDRLSSLFSSVCTPSTLRFFIWLLPPASFSCSIPLISQTHNSDHSTPSVLPSPSYANRLTRCFPMWCKRAFHATHYSWTTLT